MRKYGRWIIASLVFVAAVFFWSDLPPHKRVRCGMEVRRLRAEIEGYREQITADSLFIRELSDDEQLERYAREKFYMHAADEEVFLFE